MAKRVLLGLTVAISTGGENELRKVFVQSYFLHLHGKFNHQNSANSEADVVCCMVKGKKACTWVSYLIQESPKAREFAPDHEEPIQWFKAQKLSCVRTGNAFHKNLTWETALYLTIQLLLCCFPETWDSIPFYSRIVNFSLSSDSTKLQSCCTCWGKEQPQLSLWQTKVGGMAPKRRLTWHKLYRLMFWSLLLFLS